MENTRRGKADMFSLSDPLCQGTFIDHTDSFPFLLCNTFHILIFLPLFSSPSLQLIQISIASVSPLKTNIKGNRILGVLRAALRAGFGARVTHSKVTSSSTSSCTSPRPPPMVNNLQKLFVYVVFPILLYIELRVGFVMLTCKYARNACYR